VPLGAAPLPTMASGYLLVTTSQLTLQQGAAATQHACSGPRISHIHPVPKSVANEAGKTPAPTCVTQRFKALGLMWCLWTRDLLTTWEVYNNHSRAHRWTALIRLVHQSRHWGTYLLLCRKMLPTLASIVSAVCILPMCRLADGGTNWQHAL
jgi:hypothetical protein